VRAGDASVRLGAGLWTDAGGGTTVRGGRIGHLQVVADQPGRHRVQLLYRGVTTRGPDVALWLDGRPLAVVIAAQDGFCLASAEIDLAARAVLTIESTGPLLSPRQMRRGADERPLTLELLLPLCRIERRS
jgi:hypothetical protein